jgi:hypothetical protein
LAGPQVALADHQPFQQVMPAQFWLVVIPLGRPIESNW